MYIVTNSANPKNVVLSAQNLEKLAMNGGQVQEPKFRTKGTPGLALDRRNVRELVDMFII